MGVLVEAISIVVRRDAIDEYCEGGWHAFVSLVPNSTLCTDGEVARVGFLSPDDVRPFIEQLCERGLVFLVGGKARHLVVVDQQRGPTTPCDWIEFARLKMGDGGGKIAACWLFDEPRRVPGIHMREGSLQVAAPAGWRFEGSLSEELTVVPLGEVIH